MRILFVLEHFHPYLGGVEFLFLQLAQSLVKQGFEVEVITTRFDKKLKKTEVIDGITINRVRANNRFLFTIQSFPKILASAQYADIVHTSTYTAAIPAFVAGKLRRKVTIITFHEYWGQLWQRLPYLSWIERRLYRFFEYAVSRLTFDKVVAVSKYTKNELMDSGLPTERLCHIYNGVDYGKIEKLRSTIAENDEKKESSGEFVFVGRLGVSKGIDLILPAADKILDENKDAIFKMIIPRVPSGLYQVILDQIAQLECRDRIRLFHNLSKEDLYREILKSDFLVIPSYSEGFCFVAAETEALGVPIVSSNMGALKEVVGGQHLRAESLSVYGLYNALDLAFKNKWDMKVKSNFALDKSVQEYISLYKELVNGK